MGGYRKLPLTYILAWTILTLILATTVHWFATARVMVTGVAPLSDGRQIDITTYSGCFNYNSRLTVSSNETATTIESSNYVVIFDGLQIIVNGIHVGSLPAADDDDAFELIVDSSRGVKVKVDGTIVARAD